MHRESRPTTCQRAQDRTEDHVADHGHHDGRRIQLEEQRRAVGRDDEGHQQAATHDEAVRHPSADAAETQREEREREASTVADVAPRVAGEPRGFQIQGGPEEHAVLRWFSG